MCRSPKPVVADLCTVQWSTEPVHRLPERPAPEQVSEHTLRRRFTQLMQISSLLPTKERIKLSTASQQDVPKLQPVTQNFRAPAPSQLPTRASSPSHGLFQLALCAITRFPANAHEHAASILIRDQSWFSAGEDPDSATLMCTRLSDRVLLTRAACCPNINAKHRIQHRHSHKAWIQIHILNQYTQMATPAMPSILATQATPRTAHHLLFFTTQHRNIILLHCHNSYSAANDLPLIHQPRAP